MEEKDYKTSEAQRRASRAWDEKNKERKNYLRLRSGAKNFVKVASDEDIEWIIDLYTEEKNNRAKK